MIPVQLVREKDHLQIVWSDNTTQSISYGLLRKSCPCARCIEANEIDSDQSSAANPLQVLPVSQNQPLQIASMSPVGNYAYHIEFTDGHNTGIYTFDYLRRLK